MSTPGYDYDTGVGAGVEDVTHIHDYERKGRSDARTFALIRRLADEVTMLFTKELALLKVETTNAINDTRAGLAAMATGGAVLYAGFLFLLVAAFLGLSEVVDGWLAALIVGAVVAVVGAVMLASGKKKLEPGAFRPEHTQASLQKDREMIERNIHESHA